jgi:hypothetical protein
LDQLLPRFDKLHSKVGRPSIRTKRLRRAVLLQVLYTIRSERMLMEQLDYNVLFRWFVGLLANGRGSILIPNAAFQRASKSARPLAFRLTPDHGSIAARTGRAGRGSAVARRLGGRLLRPLTGQHTRPKSSSRNRFAHWAAKNL